MSRFFKAKEPQLPPTATGVKQTIQARHGTATFVPKGYTIKIINTYGRQVVDTWAFALHAAPTKEEWEEDNREEESTTEDDQNLKTSGESSQVMVEKESSQKDSEQDTISSGDETEPAAKPDNDVQEIVNNDTIQQQEEISPGKTVGKLNVPADAPMSSSPKPAEAAATGWSAYIPSVRGRNKTAATEASAAPESAQTSPEKPAARGWTSYLPSVGGGKKAEEPKNQRTWASYMSSGQGFSSYIPKGSISSFTQMHQRDPTKSVAEQLYDFSKTPVGAAGISVASGSGYASSLYAAYSAYNQGMAVKGEPGVGMEYLSMPHCRASTQHISPRVGDVLVTNLRAPLLAVLEDTSPGAHDTLMAACDPIRYRELGVKKWEEHGSCAENLVLTLGELNQRVGLKGRKAIGCDVTVNSVPPPLNLFMNVPYTEDGELSFAAPRGQRGDFIKFRAERDTIVVMSACPQDILEINGKKPMVAHFVVESPSEEDKMAASEHAQEAQRIIEKTRARTESEVRPKPPSKKPSSAGGPSQAPARAEASAPIRQGPPITTRQPTTVRQTSCPRPAPRKLNSAASSQASVPKKETHRVEDSPPLRATRQPTPRPGRQKPRKLERRTSTPRP